jgi:hypothetical protein
MVAAYVLASPVPPTSAAACFAPTAVHLGNRWANNPQIEAEIAAWDDATSLDEEKTIARRPNGAGLDRAYTHR